MSNIKGKTMQFRISESEKDEIERHARSWGQLQASFSESLLFHPIK